MCDAKNCENGCCTSAILEAADNKETITTEREDYNKLKWWFEHSKAQTAKTWKLLDEKLDEATKVVILEELGKNCAISIEWAEKYKGNPEGFFAFMNERAGETFDYDKENQIITVTTKERKCDCLLVDGKNMPPVYCNCSKGWQKYTYETILGKKVAVEVRESVLSGSKRCVFVVTILDD